MRQFFYLGVLALMTPWVASAGTPPTPIPRWAISVDDYPAQALRDKMVGATRFEIAISETGAARGCTIIKSSGHDVLDRTTCDLVMKRARFTPARDDADKPVPGVWRHLVGWYPWPRGSKPGYAGYGVTVTFDAAGEVTACTVAALSAVSVVTPGQADKCTGMGKAAVFAALLDRPTKGLATATYRFWRESRQFGQPLPRKQPVRRLLAHIVFDLTDDGAITWCEVDVAPVTPVLGIGAADLCGPRSYGVTRAGAGGDPQDLFIDVIATRASGANRD
jgi:TonB family protein